MKSKSNITFISLVVVFYCLGNTNCYIWNGFEMRELWYNAATTELELTAWTVASVSGVTYKYMNCSGLPFVGGYGVLKPTGETTIRTYNPSLTIKMVYFSLHFIFLDNWASTDYFEIKFNSEIVKIENFASYSDFRFDACGEAGRRGFEMRIFGKVPLTAISLTFGVSSYLGAGPTDRSFGFRELSLLFSNTTNIESKQACGVANIPLLNGFSCGCTMTQYKASNGSCISCHSDCVSCWGPSASECYRCKDYRNFNGTHCVMCDLTCAVCFREGPHGCRYCSAPLFSHR